MRTLFIYISFLFNLFPKSEIREKISENELKLGRRKSMKPDEIVS